MKNKIKTEMIIDYCKIKKMSKEDFVKQVGISKYSFSKVMKNNGDFKLTTLFFIVQKMENIKDFFE